MAGAVTISLPGGDVVIDRDDLPLLEGRAVYIGKNGYPHVSIKQKATTVHSIIMGGTRKGAHIDHRNHNKLDCRRSNLRFVTPQINQVNRARLNTNNTSGARGVVKRGSRWIAQITVKRACVYLGSFVAFEQAVTARRAAEIEHYGEACP